MRLPWTKDPDVARSLEAAEEALAEVRRLEPEIRKISAQISRHVRANHAVERIEHLFGGHA